MKIGVSAFIWKMKWRHDRLGELPKVREQGFDGFEIPKPLFGSLLHALDCAIARQG
jgi:hypothetical protein